MGRAMPAQWWTLGFDQLDVGKERVVPGAQGDHLPTYIALHLVSLWMRRPFKLLSPLLNFTISICSRSSHSR